MPDNPFFEKARELAEADFPVEQSELADPAEAEAEDATDESEPAADDSTD
jgi:hypothetical protein